MARISATMRPLIAIATLLMAHAAGFAQCPSSGTPIEYSWINPAGTYLDLGSKRPLGGTHHKIFDLRSGKFVATGTNKDAFPLREYGFVIETDTRFRISDFTNWSDRTTKIWVAKDGKDIINKTFTKYTRVFYDTVHGRGIIIEPTDGSNEKLYYLKEGSEPELLDKRYKGSSSLCTFSPDGRYAVLLGGTVIDMNSKKVLTTKLAGKKWILYGVPVISADSRFAAFEAAADDRSRNRHMLVFDIASEKLVRQFKTPDSLNSAYNRNLFPLPDMERAVVLVQRSQNPYNETGTTYILSQSGMVPLCYPGWKRERDEFYGKTSTVYNDASSETGPCPMDVAAMEADGKWSFSANGQSGVLYLSARASGEVSGTYTYTSGTTKLKGKLSGKLSAAKEGDACKHQITGNYDETLFGGGKGALTLTLGPDGKSIQGKAGSAAWSGKKD